jgi:hypothetical protein
MPAVDPNVVREAIAHQMVKREENWAKQEAGVIVVFCIVGIVAIGLISMQIHKFFAKRKAARQQFE